MRPTANAILFYCTNYKPELQFKELVAHVDSVAYPHHIDAHPDLDPAFHFDACLDPDPTFHSVSYKSRFPRFGPSTTPK
jgi:hypothetical protein